MRLRTLGLAASLLAGTMFALPALADVTITATIDKDKFVDVDETITIDKVIDVTVNMNVTVDEVAEALAIANIDNKYNSVDGYDIQRDADITNSIGKSDTTGNTGIVGVDQNAGDNNNQANLVAFAAVDDQDAFANAEASVDQRNTHNVVGAFSCSVCTVTGYWNDINLTATISGSIKHNIGVVGVNQNVGNNNNQTNAVALAVGFDNDDDDGAFALAEADLGQENTHNKVAEQNVLKVALLTGSVLSNSGVISGNQSSGNNGNQANVLGIGIAMLLDTPPFGPVNPSP